MLPRPPSPIVRKKWRRENGDDLIWDGVGSIAISGGQGMASYFSGFWLRMSMHSDVICVPPSM